jgi:geranylgeranyl diphosphate synthase type I
MNSLNKLTASYLPVLEEHMKKVVARAKGPGLEEFYYMMAYHMGWEGSGAGAEATGKRIRPLLVLFTASACGGNWQNALPAAASVELIHNFSLIHDDIEDNSPLRRGRETVWKKWGIPQAVNTGDGMFTLAHQALLDLEDPLIAYRASVIMQRTCLHLTQGQYLDLSYETRLELTPEDYMTMIKGKTSALIATCTELGALVGGAPDSQRTEFRNFGEYLGLAFQVQDDFLGIWGNTDLTGKSADSDLVTGKKSFPVLYGLKLGGPFADRWKRGSITEMEVEEISAQLEIEGGKEYTIQKSSQLTDEALMSLERAKPTGEAGEALNTLARQLLQREM